MNEPCWQNSLRPEIASSIQLQLQIKCCSVFTPQCSVKCSIQTKLDQNESADQCQPISASSACLQLLCICKLLCNPFSTNLSNDAWDIFGQWSRLVMPLTLICFGGHFWIKCEQFGCVSQVTVVLVQEKKISEVSLLGMTCRKHFSHKSASNVGDGKLSRRVCSFERSHYCPKRRLWLHSVTSIIDKSIKGLPRHPSLHLSSKSAPARTV